MNNSENIIDNAIVDVQNIMEAVKTATEKNAEKILKNTVNDIVIESNKTEDNILRKSTVGNNDIVNKSVTETEKSQALETSEELENAFETVSNITEIEIDTNNEEQELVYEIEIDDTEKNTVNSKEEIIYEIEINEAMSYPYDTKTNTKSSNSNPYSIKNPKNSTDKPKRVRGGKSFPNNLGKGDSAFTVKTPNTKKLREQIERIVSENKNLKNKLGKLQTEKISQNKIWAKIREDISGLGLYNDKLTKITKIITENTLTFSEKQEVVTELDKANSLLEAKKIYARLQSKFSSDQKINKKITESVSKPSIINESKGGLNSPSIERMKQLMKD